MDLLTYLLHVRDELRNYMPGDIRFEVPTAEADREALLEDIDTPLVIICAGPAIPLESSEGTMLQTYEAMMYWPGGLGFRTAARLQGVLYHRVTHRRNIMWTPYDFDSKSGLTLHEFNWEDLVPMDLSNTRLEEDGFVINEIHIHHDNDQLKYTQVITRNRQDRIREELEIDN